MIFTKYLKEGIMADGPSENGLTLPVFLAIHYSGMHPDQGWTSI